MKEDSDVLTNVNVNRPRMQLCTSSYRRITITANVKVLASFIYVLECISVIGFLITKPALSLEARENALLSYECARVENTMLASRTSGIRQHFAQQGSISSSFQRIQPSIHPWTEKRNIGVMTRSGEVLLIRIDYIVMFGKEWSIQRLEMKNL
ncbi:hypothetical protein DICVIV_04808 [Dictyocaulus viviparus]|uniref:Uncharacterized protein n=1 Tax=Dictyocaulus viviparus TaxID=29172 RepID=A0A0D8Y3E0_DICVI|nr:hypothetical protein DICVIV_04808 [Dictyocaulus viviparus]